MVNGNDILEFEANNVERLTEDFLRKYEIEYHQFVEDEFNNEGVR